MNFTPQDSGPIYAETLLYDGHDFIVEPWNLLSNLFFICLALFWLRSRYQYQLPASFLYCLIILAIGWVGGSLYHGFRNFELWYWMDFIPIYLLTFLASSWFWHQIRHWTIGFILFLFFFTPSIWQLNHQFNSPLIINLSYLGLMISIVLPIVILAKSHAFQNFFWMAATLASFALALFFRKFDIEFSRWINHGTHFLWHTFGALSVHFLIIYVGILRKNKLI